MKSCSKASQQTLPERVQPRKNRFQIVKLEERIAPRYSYHGHKPHYGDGR